MGGRRGASIFTTMPPGGLASVWTVALWEVQQTQLAHSVVSPTSVGRGGEILKCMCTRRSPGSVWVTAGWDCLLIQMEPAFVSAVVLGAIVACRVWYRFHTKPLTQNHHRNTDSGQHPSASKSALPPCSCCCCGCLLQSVVQVQHQSPLPDHRPSHHQSLHRSLPLRPAHHQSTYDLLCC